MAKYLLYLFAFVLAAPVAAAEEPVLNLGKHRVYRVEPAPLCVTCVIPHPDRPATLQMRRFYDKAYAGAWMAERMVYDEGTCYYGRPVLLPDG